ncbi:MAG: hypothetical protein FJ118_01055 [Deltaproteobacteria bacterium]|nr:hypothetical protein [Deltaproteobacteria bacterium]
MDSSHPLECFRCGAEHRFEPPFCPECGQVSPGLVAGGDLSVIVEDVASEKLRALLLTKIKAWFRQVDSLEADQKLKRGRWVLVSGVEEESGNRLVEALRSIKIPARLGREPGWPQALWNGSLIISAIAGLFAAFSGPLWAFLFFLTAVAAPVMGGMRKLRQMRPVIAAQFRDPHANEWFALGRWYSDLLHRLEPEDAALLKAVAGAVFDLRNRLSQPTLIATAAGERHGELYQKLHDTLATALDISRRIAECAPADRDPLRTELAQALDLLAKTQTWFRGVEQEGVKKTENLVEDLDQITRSIDRIVGEARAPETRSGLREPDRVT